MKKGNIICGIYEITSPTNKIYVGGSIDIERRKRQYNALYCKEQIKLYNSLKKYGWKNHKFEIIHECSELLLNELEMYYIQFFDSFNTPHGLNLTSGGDGGKLSDESIEKLRKSKLGKNNPNYGKVSSRKGKTYNEIYGIERADKMKKEKSEAQFGKHHTKETTEKQSKLMMGENNPMFGKHHTEESNEKNRQFHLGKHHITETIEIQRQASLGKNNPMYGKVSAFKGKHHTKESIEKQSKGMEESWKRRKSEEEKTKQKEYAV